MWIPLIEPSARAGEFCQPHSSFRWTGAELYVLPSGKIVHVSVNWTAVQGENDYQTVTVYPDAATALLAASKAVDARPAYLPELLQSADIIDHIPTTE